MRGSGRPIITRRQVLRAGAATAAAGMLDALVPGGLLRALASVASPCASLSDIEHIVILIQENRSFDHYFGTYPAVRGFSDATALRLRDGRSVFEQPDPGNTSDMPIGRLLPFHLDTSNPATAAGSGACTEDITHSWGNQHACWNRGAMDAFAAVHRKADDPFGAATMGYYTRDDLAYYYALADAFTICDGYHCSVLGPTDPNRLHAMTATLDPAGRAGGPVLSNPNQQSQAGTLSWTTYPERLQAHGVTWKQYLDPQVNTNGNVLTLFAQYQDPSSELYRRGIMPTYPLDLLADVLAGQLPQVSWIQTSDVQGEHPPAPAAFGEDVIAETIDILTLRPDIWAKTVLLITWDENGGFFDHVAPPASPPGTPGEWLTASAAQPRGPVGLGFRVPTLIVSPFSRGGFVCSDTFDHTSTLLLLERRFGVEVPNLSAWRRATVGDMTAALSPAPDASMPSLPTPLASTPGVAAQCGTNGSLLNLLGVPASPYPVPSPQSMPQQERGTRRRAAGLCGAAPVGGPGQVRPPVTGNGPVTLVTLPQTGSAEFGAGAALEAAALLGAAASITLRIRRRGEASEAPGPESCTTE
jgi:phospholipase C